MKTLKFSVYISAPRPVVWNILWGNETYKAWTSAFSEGSFAVSDWNEGSKIQFLSHEGTGMNSIIARKIPDEFMSFQHIGVIESGIENTKSDESKNWLGAFENYTLTEQNGMTELKVEVDISEVYVKYMEDVFPMALRKVKELAEGIKVFSM
jgi:hypothetical protein